MAADRHQNGDSFVAAIFHDLDLFKQALSALLAAGIEPANISVLGEHQASYARKLVTVTSGGVLDWLDPVLERYSFDELGEVA